MMTEPYHCAICASFVEFLRRAEAERPPIDRILTRLRWYVAALLRGRICPAHTLTLALARTLTATAAAASEQERKVAPCITV